VNRFDVGAHLGPYDIAGKIGAGGMGEVWRARDTRLGREVALKFLPEDFAEDPERHARFECEARVLASLNHPHIAVLYGLEHLDGHHALAMELVEGEGLDERIARGPVQIEEAMPIALQIAEALEAAHEKGIVHRDLKPANVKVRHDGTVKVLDFGLAKAWTAEEGSSDPATSPTITSRHTQAGMILGTAAYMAPEQARGRPADKRADIWAFGVLLYEMLSGRRLFDGETVSDVLAGVLRQDPDWKLLPPTTPESLRRLLQRCLVREPRQRLRDIGEARIVLESGDQQGIEPPSVHQPAHSPYRFLWWALTPAAVLILFAAGYFAAFGRRTSLTAPRLTFLQKTFRSQTIFSARFAPDGKTLVYSAAEEGSAPQLFVVRPDYPEPQPLGMEDTQLLSISSQGELAVLSHAQWIDHRLFQGTLGRVPLGGGAPRDLVDHVREADWSPDGAHLAIIRDVAGRDRLEFPIGNTLYEASGYLSDPRVSPDGDRVAFFEHPTRFDDRGSVAVVDRSGKRTVLASGYQGEEGLAWLPGSKAILFSAVVQGGYFQTTSVDLAGHARPIEPIPGNVTVQDVSPDGTWLLTRDDVATQVMVRPPGASDSRDFSWLDVSLVPSISHDGRLVAISDQGPTGGANYTVLLRKSDGSRFVRLGEGYPAAFSRDGRWLAVIVPVTPQKVMLYPTGTGEPRRADRGQIEAYSNAEWFPDGKRLLVSGNEPGQAPRCYIMPLDGGSLRPVTPEGSTDGRVSPDGALVGARTASDGYRIYPIDGGTPRDVPSIAQDDVVIRWSPDGRALWTYAAASFPVQVDSVDIATGLRRPLETIELHDRQGVLSVLRVVLADDPHVFAYVVWHYVSHLFVAERMK
jgi:Tol biopolymer transport system component